MLIQSLGWEDSLEKGMETHSSILAWKFQGQRKLVGYSPWGHKERIQLNDEAFMHEGRVMR